MLTMLNKPISDIPLPILLRNDVSKNVDLPCEMINHLMTGLATCGVTGTVGSGKITAMRSMIRYTDPKNILRVFADDAAYLKLDVAYPDRNVVIVGALAKPMDSLYSTVRPDTYIDIISEVFTDARATQMIKYSKESGSTLFTHIASTTKELVRSLKNSLCSKGVYTTNRLAEKRVANFLDCDIHLDYNEYGIRYIERITEIIWKADTLNTRDIIRYDLATDTYVVVNPLSDALRAKLLSNMDTSKSEAFKQFLANNF